MDKETIVNNFSYHPPTEKSQETFIDLRSRVLGVALWIESHVPASPERTLALRSLEQALMWANASVARYQEDEKNDG